MASSSDMHYLYKPPGGVSTRSSNQHQVRTCSRAWKDVSCCERGCWRFCRWTRPLLRHWLWRDVAVEWQALGPIALPHCARRGVFPVPHPNPSCFDTCRHPRDVTCSKLFKSDWKDDQTVNRHGVGLISPFRSSSIMSANKTLGDRSDIPDLLKSLADYPFSFPDFEDAGKFKKKKKKSSNGTFWTVFSSCLERVWYYLNNQGICKLLIN